MTRARISVDGLTKFSRALKKIDTDAPKELRAELKTIADVLVDETRPQIPKRTGNAARSLKPRATRNTVKISVGGTKAPYYPWLDFGGRTGIHKSVGRKFYTEGRYLYPTFRKMKPEIEAMLIKAIRRTATEAGMEVSG